MHSFLCIVWYQRALPVPINLGWIRPSTPDHEVIMCLRAGHPPAINSPPPFLPYVKNCISVPLCNDSGITTTQTLTISALLAATTISEGQQRFRYEAV